MASSLREDLRCPVCLDFYVDPQMLDCGHNFCLTCVKSCIPSWRDKGKCPECRVPFKRHYYTSNRALGNLAEKARQLELDEESQLGTPVQHICKEHNEPMKLFCKRDLAPACVFCRSQPQHRRHVFVSIHRSVDYAEEVLEPYKTWLGNCLKEITHVQKVKERKTAKIMICSKEIFTHIAKACQAFAEVLQEKGEELSKNEEKKAKNLNELRDALRSIQELSSLTDMNTQIITENAPAGNCMIPKVLQEKEENLNKNVEQMEEKNMEVSSLQEEVSKEDEDMKEKKMEVMQNSLSSLQEEVSKEDVEMKEDKEDVEMKEKNMEVMQTSKMNAQVKTMCATADNFISLETSAEEIISDILKGCLVFCQTLQEKHLNLKKKVEEMKTENMEEDEKVPEKVPSRKKKKKKIQIIKCVAVDDYIFLKDFKDLIDRIKQLQPQMDQLKGLKGVRLVRKAKGKWKRGPFFHRGRGWRLGGRLQKRSGACRSKDLIKEGGEVESQGCSQEKEGGEGTSQQL